MALGPKEMAAAIVRNLKQKTGRDLEEWFAVIDHSGLKDKKEILRHLREEHELGFFQSQKVYERYAERTTPEE